jgi:alpha-glucosidase
MSFSCEATAEGMRLKITPHKGSYPAWWKEIRAEIYGWTPKQGSVLINAKESSLQIDKQAHSFSFLIADDGSGVDVEVK